MTKEISVKRLAYVAVGSSFLPLAWLSVCLPDSCGSNTMRLDDTLPLILPRFKARSLFPLKGRAKIASGG